MADQESFIGRGSSNQQSGRFEPIQLTDLEPPNFQGAHKLATEYFEDDSQSIVSKNHSPDLHFNFSLNPYRGCVHGCSYCYARPSHEYLGWGPGIDFESKIVVKRNAVALFKTWLKKRKPEQVEPVMLSGVTDCYQPIERKLEITRGCLRAAAEFQHPIQVITKNNLVCRDLDLLAELATKKLVNVAISVTSLQQSLTRKLEPRTSSPESRLKTIAKLSQAGIPVIVSVSPIIPGLNDEEIPAILKAVHERGASSAFYVMLRLPMTVQDVFVEWLEQHFPDRKSKVIGRIQSLRDGRLNSSQFGERMRGSGIWAEQIRQVFQMFTKQYGLDGKPDALRNDLFRIVSENGQHQKQLF